jgi:CHAD domain-containing protein
VPFQLKTGRNVEREMQRVADTQLVLALRQLHTIGTRGGDRAVHEARRHVRRVRAMLRLVRPTLGDAYVRANRRLRRAHHLLAPIADAEALVDRQRDVAGWLDGRVPASILAAVRSSLTRHAAAVDRRASFERVLHRAGRLLRAERLAIDEWTLAARGVGAIGPGLERTVRDTRHAMHTALQRPTAAHYHAWRRRVKDLRLQVHLLSLRCGGRLGEEERRLTALDACLGEYHDLVLLEHLLMTEVDVSRSAAAVCLRVLRQRQALLRENAARLGPLALSEGPRAFVRHVGRLWRTPPDRADTRH